MTELDGILESMTEWDARGVGFALATVVGTRGSTYRGLAARQLVSETGASVGTISGGCLDNDLRAVAVRVITTGRSELVEFDLTADDEAIWGWGIGCNGATEVLVEPAESAIEVGTHLKSARLGQSLAITHSLSIDSLAERRYVTPVGASPIVGQLATEAHQSLRDGRHRVADVAGSRYMIEVVGTPSHLVICGAGHDADPVVRFGRQLGFLVTVTDDRSHLLTLERFGDDVELVHAEASEFGSVVSVDERTYVVLMSHNYLRDLEYLRQLHGSNVAYVGALGPAERLDRLLGDLAAEGVEFGAAWKDRLWGPAGLDVGADGPVEIAWSVLSEILAVRAGRKGGQVSVRKRATTEVDAD